MSISEYMEELKSLIKMLIKDVQEVKNEIAEVRNDINILKMEIRNPKENRNKKIDKKLIEREMTRIGKKHVEQENFVIETGSMDDRFRKEILSKILEEEERYLKELGKLKIDEDDDKNE